jgi:phosphoglycerate dehydrogenase-like enzyme
MPLKVVFFGGFEGPDLAALRERLPSVEIVLVPHDERDRLREELADADAYVGNLLEPEDTERASRLRLVQAFSAGADRVDPAALPPGAVLCNLHGPERAIAEWALMCMLALSRRLLVYDRALRQGRWHRYGDETFELERLLRGRVLGVVGLGHIGRETAALGRAVGMEVVGVTRSPSPQRGEGLRRLGGLAELPRLLAESDFVVVAVPVTAETRGLIGADELRALGRDGYLLNPSRGEVVDEEALYHALRDGTIAGAAIDTWYRYPRAAGDVVHPSRFPFGELDNVVMTPHSSGRSEETRAVRWAWLEAQLRRLERGEPLENVLHVRD